MKHSRCALVCLVFAGLTMLPVQPAHSVEDAAPQAAASTLREHEEMVFEPVFKSQVAIHHCGDESLPAVVLIHGMGENGMRDWENVLPALEGRFHVLTFDLPGFARSDKQNVRYTMTLYAAFVKWAVDRYIDGPFTVVGHSFGGAVALRFASTYPRDLERLVLADVAGVQHEVAIVKFLVDQQAQRLVPGFKQTPLSGLLQGLADNLLQKLNRIPLDAEIAVGSSTTRGRLMSADPMKIAGFSLAFEDFSELFQLVEAPTLILWGSEDTVTPLRTGQILERRLGNARLEIIGSSGHVPMFDQPAAFNRRLLKELTSPPRAVPERPARKDRGITDRVGRCENRRGVTFDGSYDRIIISGCRGVVLQDVVARGLIIEGSEVEISGSEIGGGAIGMVVRESSLKVTASRIEGDIAISVAGGRLDLAAVDLVASTASIHVEQKSSLVASVCTVKSPVAEGPLHDCRELDLDERL